MKECGECGNCFEDATASCPLDGHALTEAFPGPPVLDNKYRLERRFGRGGMGAVYRARHLGLDKIFAVKLIHRDMSDRFLSRFNLEAKALGRLNHPNIVLVTDFGVDPRGDGIPYLTMEYLEGASLYGYLNSHGPVSPEELVPLLYGMASGIDFAHKNGILHRDLKPANIFLCDSQGGGKRPKILDFGIARFFESADRSYVQAAGPPASAGSDITNRMRLNTDSVETMETHDPGAVKPEIQQAAVVSKPAVDSDSLQTMDSGDMVQTMDSTDMVQMIDGPLLSVEENLTLPGTILGTPEYMSPEAIRGEEPASSFDIYSFGIVIFEMLTGRRPFQDRFPHILDSQKNKQPPNPSEVRPGLPPEMDESILACLRKKPEERPATAMEAVSRMAAACHMAMVAAWKKREFPRRIVLSAGMAIVLLVVHYTLEVWSVGRELEGKLVDARFYFSTPADPEISPVILLIDDATLEANETALVEMADETGTLLQRVYEAGARGVAVDLLLPKRWSNSIPFSTLILNHSDTLMLAAWTTPEGNILGPEVISGLTAVALGPEKSRALFSFVNVPADPDGVTRRFQGVFPDAAGTQYNSFGAELAKRISGNDPGATTDPGWIDFRANRKDWKTLSWKDLPGELDHRPQTFRDRFVILGAAYSGSGDEFWKTPHLRGFPEGVSGTALHALICNTLLSGRPVRSVSSAQRFLFAGAAFCLVLLILYLPRLRTALELAAAVTAAYAVTSFLLFLKMALVVPIFPPVFSMILGAGAAVYLRTRLSRYPEPLIPGEKT